MLPAITSVVGWSEVFHGLSREQPAGKAPGREGQASASEARQSKPANPPTSKRDCESGKHLDRK